MPRPGEITSTYAEFADPTDMLESKVPSPPIMLLPVLDPCIVLSIVSLAATSTLPVLIVIVFVAPDPDATTLAPTKLSVVAVVDSAEPSS